jgi:nicotinate-nucleotide adenylyltransferase
LKRLVFCTKDLRLRVRPAFPDEQFEKSCYWKDKLEFIISEEIDFTMIWTSLLPDLEPVYAQALVDLVGARYPVSPDYEKLLQTCPDLIFTHEASEWVFYGGSFNPWHNGHQACLDLLPEEKLCLVLPDRNPLKALHEINLVSTVLQISTNAKFKKYQFLVPSFILQPERNPTVEWIEKLSKTHPVLKLSLLMGFDSFAGLKSWRRPQDLLRHLHTIYVASRLENSIKRQEALNEAKLLCPDIQVVFLGKHPYEDLSSTEIRKKKRD